MISDTLKNELDLLNQRIKEMEEHLKDDKSFDYDETKKEIENKITLFVIDYLKKNDFNFEKDRLEDKSMLRIKEIDDGGNGKVRLVLNRRWYRAHYFSSVWFLGRWNTDYNEPIIKGLSTVCSQINNHLISIIDHFRFIREKLNIKVSYINTDLKLITRTIDRIECDSGGDFTLSDKNDDIKLFKNELYQIFLNESMSNVLKEYIDERNNNEENLKGKREEVLKTINEMVGVDFEKHIIAMRLSK